MRRADIIADRIRRFEERYPIGYVVHRDHASVVSRIIDFKWAPVKHKDNADSQWVMRVE